MEGSGFLSGTPDLARTLLEEAAAVLRPLPTTKWHALCLIRQADLAKNTGRRADALRLYDEALELVRAFAYDYGLMLCGGNRAELLYDFGRPDEAIEAFRSLWRELPVGTRAPVVSLMTWHLAIAGKTDEAYDAVAEVVAGFRVTGLRGAVARVLEALALLRARAGDLERAACLLGWGRSRHPPTRPSGPRYVASRETIERVEAGLSAATCETLLVQGSAWSDEEALAVADQALDAWRCVPMGFG